MTKRKRKSFNQKAKKFGKRGNYGKGSSVSEDVFQYFTRIMEVDIDSFQSIEERDAFINNVFNQTKDEEIEFCKNQFISRVMEKLLPLASVEILQRFMDKFGNALQMLSSDPFSSHVLECLITISSEKYQESEIFLEWILKVGKFMLNNLEDFVWDKYANMVTRTVLESLSNLPFGSTTGRNKKSNMKVTNISRTNREPLDEFILLGKEFTKKIIKWPFFSDLLYQDLTSGFLQSLVLCSNALDQKQTHRLIKRILKDCISSEGEELNDKLTYCPTIFDNDSCIRLLETVISVCKPKQLHKIYKNCFKGHLGELSKSRSANFSVQKLFNAVDEKSEVALFEDMYDEISEHLEGVWLFGNLGVILNVAKACQHLGVKQPQFLLDIMKIVHCLEDDRQIKVAQLVLALSTYEDFVSNENLNPKIHLHGSLLLQELLSFKKPIKIVRSLLEMENEDLVSLFSDDKGSRVMDSFMSAEFIGLKNREKLILKLQGNFVAMACSKYGSRSLDSVWSAARINMRQRIAAELSAKEAELNRNCFGRIIARNTEIYLYRYNIDEWKIAQQNPQKKRTSFAGIELSDKK